MIGSRFNFERQALSLERLKDFVALDSITAQVPLIEVNRNKIVRIWTAYDLTRSFGTFVQVCPSGDVRTVTIYPSGRRHEVINRPAYGKLERVRKEKKLRSAVSKSKRFKAVHARSKHASAKKQRSA